MTEDCLSISEILVSFLMRARVKKSSVANDQRALSSMYPGRKGLVSNRSASSKGRPSSEDKSWLAVVLPLAMGPMTVTCLVGRESRRVC